jgi:hypothetical protein
MRKWSVFMASVCVLGCICLLARPAAIAQGTTVEVAVESRVEKDPPPETLRMQSAPTLPTPALSSYTEAVAIADAYLEDRLGAGFESSHMELLGLDERPDIPSLWFVVYRYHSTGNSVDLSVAVDHGSSPGDPSRIAEDVCKMIGAPQEIRISKELAEQIVLDRGVPGPYSTILELDRVSRRLVWLVQNHDVVEPGAVKGFKVDAETGELAAIPADPPPMPVPELASDTSEPRNFIPRSDLDIMTEPIVLGEGELGAGDIYISSVSWTIKLTRSENQSMEIWSYNGDSSSHTLYHYLTLHLPTGGTQYIEGDHISVSPGNWLVDTFVIGNGTAGIGIFTFDVELWEEIAYWPDNEHDDQNGNKFYWLFDRPGGVSTNYYCDDTWHHPSNTTILETALNQVSGYTSVSSAVSTLKTYVYNQVTYDLDYGARSSDLQILSDLRGDCNDFSDLYTGLARAANIPTRVVSGSTYESSPSCDPSKGSSITLCGVYCSNVNYYWGHQWSESHYTSGTYGTAFHHVDPTWNDMENARAYLNSTCVGHVHASTLTECADNYQDDCARKADTLKQVNGWLDVTTATDAGYDTSYWCPNDADADGTCDTTDTDRDGDGIPDSSDAQPCVCNPPGEPTPSSPGDYSDTCDPRPLFNWTDVDRATSYHILVDDDFDFSTPLIDTSPLVSNYMPGFDMLPDTYYWKVAATNYCGGGSFSFPAWRFTVNAPTPSLAPTLQQPGNTTSTCDDMPYFNWTDVDGATSYRIQVDNNSNFSSPEIDATPSGSQYTTAMPLDPGLYYWRSRGENSCGNGPWSSPVWSFTVNAAPSSAPSLSEPGNGSSTCDDTPFFNWPDVDRATSYRIQVDNNSGFTSMEINTTSSVSEYTPGTGLAPDTYFWRVQGTNSCGDGPWSSPTWSFTVNAAPSSAPSLSEPGNGSNTCDDTPYFNWPDVDGATAYRIQVDNNSGFASPEIDTTPSISQYTPGAGLAPGTYFWRVQGTNSCGDGPWSSPTWSFTINNPAPSIAPAQSQPPNASGTCDSTPFFNWAEVAGATSYDIEVDNNSNFSSPEIDASPSESEHTPSVPLSPNIYYWRVRASNSCGDGPWSSPAWSVTINQAAPATAPTPMLPVNTSSTCDSTPYIDWSDVGGATAYRIQVDNNSGFTSPEIDTTRSDSNYTPSTGLAPDTYYWRVLASNGCGDGPWSSPTWSLTVDTPAPSSAPTLFDPSNGTGTCDATPDFDWSNVTGAMSYRIQVDNDSGFGSPEINVTPSVSNYTPSAPLSPDTYYWRVQGYNGCGDGPWSSPTWSFTVDQSAPSSAPSLYEPTTGSGSCDATPFFDWSNVSGATAYRIQVDNDSGFGSPEINVTPSVSNYTPSSPLSPDTYYWRVQGYNGCGDGPWSSPTWNFTVNTPAPTSAPTLSLPANGSGTCDSTPYFDWSTVSGATSYRIQVDDDAGFGSPEIDATPSVSHYTAPFSLSPDTYYWRVLAHNGCGDGPWSSPWSVTINDSAPTSAPSLSTPADTSTTGDNTPAFDWSDVTGATSYRIQVDDDSNFSSPAVDATPSVSSYTPGSPLSDGTYYWRVLGHNGCGDGPCSSPWSFTVDTSTPVVGPLTFDTYSADDDDLGDSSGNGNAVVDCGETIELLVTLFNEGTDTATEVNATISESDSYVAFVNNTSSGYPDIPGTGTGTNTDDYDFTVDPGTPDAHVIHFDLDITASNGGPWTDSFDVTVSCGNSAPTLSWTGETNYVSDGLHPESGGTSDSYIYRVKYADVDGDAPNYVRVHIEKGGSDIIDSPFTMSYVSGSHTTGAIYSYTKAGLAEGSDYTYYFEAQDSQGNPATPTTELDGPDVSDGGLPEWTFLVYLIGDVIGSTEDAAIDDFLEMSSIGSTSDVNIVVWFDPLGDTYTWDHTHKFYVTKDMTPDPANGVYLGEKDMSDPQTLVDFVQTETANHPAEHYALIIWDRGSEVRRDPPDGTLLGDVCFDDNPILSTWAMSMPDLSNALSTITNDGADPLDLLGFDASWMALTEIDKQLIPYADVRVSSQGTEPAEGWAYNEVLTWLTLVPEMTPAEFGYQIVDWYCPTYGNEPTMSAVDLQIPYGDLNTAVDELTTALMAGAATHHTDIATARGNTQAFTDTHYVDLYDFAWQLNAHVTDAAINSAATEVMDAVDNAVINDCGSLFWPDAHGISIYFPESEEDYDEDYDGYQGRLLFTADHEWDEWLHVFYIMGPIAGFPFYDDFESGALGLGWSTFVTGTGRARVSSPSFRYEGSYTLSLDNEFEHANDSIAAAILTIDLSGQSEVYLDFWWRDWYDETQPQDGVFFSDDWGLNWYQIYPFELDPVSWYAHPIIDLAAEAATHGLTLNDHFQIKFQSYASEPISSSGNSDGYTIDAIWIDSSPHGVATLPFYDSFESGMQLFDVWQEYQPNCGNVSVVLPEYPHGNCYPHDGEYSLLLEGSDYSCSGNHTAAAILTLDLSHEAGALLDFWWKEWNDENHPEDGVFFSDDQGATWYQVFSFNDGPSTYQHDIVDIAEQARAHGLAFSDIFQIKFQFYDNSAYPTDGYSIDEIRIRDAGSLLPLVANQYP